MKGKIIGLIISMLFICSVVGATNPDVQTGQAPTSLDDDVPIWNEGDSWTYTVNDFTVDYQQGGQLVYINGDINDFTLTVTDTSGSYYQVEFTGDLNCNYEIYLESSLKLYVTGTMKDTLTKLQGTITFTQSDLQIHDATAQITGITFGTIAPLPIPLPLPFKITVNSDLSTDFPLFEFPLYVLKSWDMPELDATMGFRAGGPLGLIQIPVNFNIHYSWVPFAFICTGQEQVTVPAGTFTAYRIQSLLFDIFDYYYAPSVGNIVKLDGDMPNAEVNAVLKEYNWP